MKTFNSIGTSPLRADAAAKTGGTLRYTDDRVRPGTLQAAVLASPYAHARITAIDTAAARRAPGVRGVFTGADWPEVLIGLYLGDKPPLARGAVRYYGEPVAVVVADDEAAALAALRLLEVQFEPLPTLASPSAALAAGAAVLHPALADYRRIPAILPEPGSNVANRTRIRKGDAAAVFATAEAAGAVVMEGCFSFPPGDHVAMEPRAVLAEYGLDGRLTVASSTQSPFGVRTLLAKALGLPERDIVVRAAPVGGGFGGKAGIQLEPLAALLALRFPGRPVRLTNTRELDLLSSPGRPGLESYVRLAARPDGELLALDMDLLFDSGAYADYAVNVSRAAAAACTGPYRVPHVRVDSLCVYTNHPFATAFRGFGHIELSYATERAMDLLAERLGMDPAELRRRNAILPGDTTPTGASLDASTGDLPACIDAVRRRLDWTAGTRSVQADGKVRAKGLACFWKAPAIPTFTEAAATVSFAEDGSVCLATGVVEIGQGTHDGLRLLVAEALAMDPGLVRVINEVDTDLSPHDWTTAASRSLFMAGRAALQAVEDATGQIRQTAAAVLRCPPEDLAVGGGRVCLRDDPERGLPLAALVLGYVYPDGNAVGGPVIGRGRYIARHLSGMDPASGAGRPGLEWTMGAEGVEIELDPRDGRLRVLRSACAMDVGTVVHPALARAQVVGAMGMGIGYATREAFQFDSHEAVVNGSLRDYKILRYGEDPQYFIDFVETPQGDGPYGARGLGEQGIIGMPGALAQAVSTAAGVQLCELPLTPEYIWRSMRAARNKTEGQA
ncbi:MAG: aldehyde oxidase [Spirochaetes bacterium GWD1_61_31]|nr:MAG: aldehyde oxidase [Spirochaetes bacterium GWB1_60_80]OHD33754.1 MAG: aldehyde oxidase [Spirochaetes bacterium GWC1_61_12]OHD38977.1 MAG: aldehyde oxidase [Spirochaetes bacterium GWD1_61_31]OHD43427.1 MAG: aldehyde oxidase [Spirochaetes bacterium GWE1_60_18]OHD58958.1 MAG: aldehyde oxidase [Spirochaetes bacterium GWF1_60_12]HAP42639.1 aldehyde oxidase [Spirochaetaceae bacterium]